MLRLPLLMAAGAPGLTPVPRAAAEQSRWSPDRANRWYQAQAWPVGANYITSNAINQLEMFQADTFDPQRIDTELGWARLYGLNTVRVFLHDQLWAQDSWGFRKRLLEFVTIAAHHSIKPLFVFFDSCWDPFPKLGPQRAPRPGVHNSGWVQSPGAEHLDDLDYRGTLRDYVTGVLNQFRNDHRVLGWDLWNEPDNPSRVYRAVERKDKQERVADLLSLAFGWARSVDPSQPLTSGVWDGESREILSAAAQSLIFNWTTRTWSHSTAMTDQRHLRLGSPNFPHWGGPSFVPSTWLARSAAPLTKSCQLRSATT